jgi:nucleotide-binding universal stress UspA family protein
LLGKGPVVEQWFSGAMRRLRLRLPHMPGTRQVWPAASFGEEGLLVDGLVPAEFPWAEGDLWVHLRDWTILEQAPPRLLVLDSAEAEKSSLHLARLMAEKMQAAVTVAGVHAHKGGQEARQELRTRMDQAGLKDGDLHVVGGDLVAQIGVLSAGSIFEFMILPRRLSQGHEDVDSDVISVLERADLPTIITNGEIGPQIARILVCTRAGEPGKNDIRFGGRLARHLGARVTLLHVTTDSGTTGPLVSRHLRQASGTLLALDVQNEILIRASRYPAEAILKEAAAHELVVMGGHGPHARSLFGRDNVTMQVLRRSLCPVLVVPMEQR